MFIITTDNSFIKSNIILANNYNIFILTFSICGF